MVIAILKRDYDRYKNDTLCENILVSVILLPRVTSSLETVRWKKAPPDLFISFISDILLSSTSYEPTLRNFFLKAEETNRQTVRNSLPITIYLDVTKTTLAFTTIVILADLLVVLRSST